MADAKLIWTVSFLIALTLLVLAVELALAYRKLSKQYKAQRDSLLKTMQEAQVSSGVCCCGDDVDAHSYAGHSPVDLWDHVVRRAVEDIEKFDKEQEVKYG